MDDMKKPMKLKEAAEYLGYHPEYLRQLAKDGVVPSHKLSGRLFFYAEEINEAIKSDKGNG